MTPRRKRLLIALAALLALSAGFRWLMRPVIDSRLVGTWFDQYTAERYEFRADGTGAATAFGFMWMGQATLSWSADGETVTMRSREPFPGWNPRLIQWMADRFLNPPNRTSVERYYVKEPDIIELQDKQSSSSQRQTLNRVIDSPNQKHPVPPDFSESGPRLW